ncbi:hypothetical protein F5888DRAFT_1803621 [Russula emetica]|nr:hypothetical protein F5888DRAFT_1803621 [Russula emetica]
MSNIKAQIVDFLNDFDNASSRADQVNLKITNNSDSVVVALGQMIFIAIAEVYGSMQLTTGTDAHGNPDVLMFMKNIGGVQKNRVNAVETLYAAFPALMYLDPSLGAPLLEPLFRLQASHNYTLNMPLLISGVEQTGNMLIMTYAYARASGDGSLISRYYPLLTTWANYLNASTLFISNQSSADNLTVNNQTNLAIKGIIAIEAMSKMSSVVNHKKTQINTPSSAAASLYAQWKNLALSSDQHLLAVYGQSDSWTLGYNLFADVWLGTNLVESLVYSGQSNFIYTLLSNPNFSNFGLPVDNADANVAVSSWSLFVAAMTNDEPLRSELIVRVSDRSSNTSIPASVFSVYYDSANGTSLQGVASPAQGAVFAPIALNAPVLTINPTPHRKRKIGAIVGGICGAGAILAVIGIVTFLQRQHRWKLKRNGLRFSSTSSTDSIPMDLLPVAASSELIVDPFVYEAALDVRILAEQQPFLTEEQVALHRLFPMPPTVPPLSQPGTPVPGPVRLTDKEIALWRRLHAQVFNSQESRNHVVSSSNALGSTSSPNAVREYREAPYDPRRLLDSEPEVESLVRRTVERLQAEGLIEARPIGAPPSYREGDE